MGEGFYSSLGYGYMSKISDYMGIGKQRFTQRMLSYWIGYKIKITQAMNFMFELGVSYLQMKKIEYRKLDYTTYLEYQTYIYSPTLAPRLDGYLTLREDKRLLVGVGVGYLLGTSTFNYKDTALQTQENAGLLRYPPIYPYKFGGLQFTVFLGYKL